MSIFTSKRPEDFDPEPWVHTSGGPRSTHDEGAHSWRRDPRPEFQPTRDPQPWHDPELKVRFARATESEKEWSDWAPRPEFTTLGNPILIEYRGGTGHGPEKAAQYLRLLDGDVYDWRNVAPDQVDHARKVLTRLAVLS